jgi:DNA adenine methylase
MSFPDTRFMGSKRKILPFIIEHSKPLRFRTVLDAFSGSGCVAYAFKELGAKVHANDMLRFAYHTARATVENSTLRLNDKDVRQLLKANRRARSFIRDTFCNLYFSQRDNEFLDNLWANIEELESPLKRSMAIAVACRAAMKKRPRGIFTFVGRKGWDGRRDLRLTMREQFLIAVEALNWAVFSNGKKNRALCQDVFDVEPNDYDLVYIDPPYISPYSDCDYTRRYHFVEGFCSYWKDVELQLGTLTKKFRSYPTAFAKRSEAEESFQRLFHHFRRSVLVVSYSSNGIPWKDQLTRLLKEVKRDVKVYETPHLYSFGNHHHKVGNNNNAVREYLFVAS